MDENERMVALAFAPPAWRAPSRPPGLFPPAPSGCCGTWSTIPDMFLTAVLPEYQAQASTPSRWNPAARRHPQWHPIPPRRPHAEWERQDPFSALFFLRRSSTSVAGAISKTCSRIEGLPFFLHRHPTVGRIPGPACGPAHGRRRAQRDNRPGLRLGRVGLAAGASAPGRQNAAAPAGQTPDLPFYRHIAGEIGNGF